jgi:hypothetical protein
MAHQFTVKYMCKNKIVHSTKITSIDEKHAKETIEKMASGNVVLEVKK